MQTNAASKRVTRPIATRNVLMVAATSGTASPRWRSCRFWSGILRSIEAMADSHP
ncbi:MAG: hypothetical protein MZV64_59685 [Ignavibacteriales bacterium]|nr:hypothetical protein [Ignavibacteriales bacterium]